MIDNDILYKKYEIWLKIVLALYNVYRVIIRTLLAWSTLAPALTKNSHTGRWPSIEASDKGVDPSYIN